MAVINSPFESQYGFKGPGFTVDANGNIVANSIVTSTVVDGADSAIVDFTVVDTNNDFFIAELGVSANPTMTLARQSSYNFSLTVPDLKFQIVVAPSASADNYDTGLTHSSGSTGAAAQNKTDGTLRWSIPLNAPNILYYSDEIGNNFGTINIIDPVGQFSTVDINSTTNATSSTTGAITIAGGASVEKDFYIGGQRNVAGVGIPKLSSLTNLELNADNKVILQINNIKVGELSSTGLSVTINNSTIDNTVIGATAPSTAAFTSGTVTTLPTVDTSITNRRYVDSTALSLAIAFGL